jgi:tellurite resistance protein
MKIDDKVQICKIVVQAIIADATITDSEHDFLSKLMDRYEIAADQRKEILSQNIGADPAEAIALLKSDESRNDLMVELALAVAVDGEISSSERKLLGRIAQVLGISAPDLELMLKAAMA